MIGMGGFFKLDWHLNFSSCGSATVLDKGLLRLLLKEFLEIVRNRWRLVWSLLNADIFLGQVIA